MNKMYYYMVYVYSYDGTCVFLVSYHLIFLHSYHILSQCGLNWLPCLLLCLYINVNKFSLLLGKYKRCPCAVVVGPMPEGCAVKIIFPTEMHVRENLHLTLNFIMSKKSANKS